MTCEKYYLMPNAGAGKKQKSYYGKAIVENFDNNKILYSYGTRILTINGKGQVIKNWSGWSATTAKHINSFLYANGKKTFNKKEWEALPVGEVLDI